MMLVADLNELQMHPVADRGVPNLERIAIYVKEPTNMGQYGIMVGLSALGAAAIPYQDNLFWFGDGVMNAGDWILLYTGKGTPRTEDWKPTGGKVYSLHWGRSKTMFANTNIVPILFRVDAVDLAAPPQDLPQIGNEGA
nr:hypothetical protein [uncultured bacterium]